MHSVAKDFSSMTGNRGVFCWREMILLFKYLYEVTFVAEAESVACLIDGFARSSILRRL